MRSTISLHAVHFSDVAHAHSDTFDIVCVNKQVVDGLLIIIIIAGVLFLLIMESPTIFLTRENDN